jgi:hypothetical protein
VTVGEAKLVQIRRQVEVQGEHYPWLSQLSTQSFYDAGFPKSQDECLLQEGFSFAQGDRSFSSADSPEFWFYSFWFRRYHEGRFEVTAKLLQMLVGPSAAPLAPGPAEK